MRLKERFIEYCKINTQSDASSTTTPTTMRQFDLARKLEAEMREIGLIDVVLDDKCYVYGTIPATVEGAKTIGFIAHMDTSSDCGGDNVKPVIIDNYDGNDIVLNEGIVMKVEQFPRLSTFVGKELIVTDGTTLLGADDKAGIAIIMEMATILMSDLSIPHGTIKIAFTPDEEVGRGADHFNVDFFGCDFAYTVDGDKVNVIADENFNACHVNVVVDGVSIHPGSAKDRMINANNVAMEFHKLLPKTCRPEHTEKREGFNHLCSMNGTVEQMKMQYIVRNHDRCLFEKQQELFLLAAELINLRYRKQLVSIEIIQEYANMYEILKDKQDVVDIAKEAIVQIGLEVEMEAIRGGTDGSRLTFMGLPCPNLGTGGGNFHGKYEFCCVDEMKQALEIVLAICKIVSERKELE